VIPAPATTMDFADRILSLHALRDALVSSVEVMFLKGVSSLYLAPVATTLGGIVSLSDGTVVEARSGVCVCV
jgi:hypothetical protein